MNKHSPGPWRAVKTGLYSVTHNILDAKGMIRAIDVGPPDGDARLISVAPEMLALLQEVAIGCICHLGTAGEVCWNCRRLALLRRIDGE